MVVVKIVDQNTIDKVDTQYISDQFTHVENIGMIFTCVEDGEDEDDWTDEDDGMRYISINLPYEEVLKLEDVRPMMLAKAKEKLGLVA